MVIIFNLKAIKFNIIDCGCFRVCVPTDSDRECSEEFVCEFEKVYE